MCPDVFLSNVVPYLIVLGIHNVFFPYLQDSEKKNENKKLNKILTIGL